MFLLARLFSFITPLPDRNGKTYLAPCLYSHAPFDLVILIFGSAINKRLYYDEGDDIWVGVGCSNQSNALRAFTLLARVG
jgi:hypothetical protein